MTDLKKIEFLNDLMAVLNSIAVMLSKKNESYGDSALNPKRIFSKADSVEQIKVRIDDKLSRIQNGSSFENDNDLDDLLGYLVLLKIAINRQKKANLAKKVVESVADMMADLLEELRCHGWRPIKKNNIWDSADPMQMTVGHHPSINKKHEEEFRRQEIKQKIMDERDYDNPELHVPD